MPKGKMGCWCPVDNKPKITLYLIVLLYIIAIVFLAYLSITDGAWVVYVPTILIVIGSLLWLVSR